MTKPFGIDELLARIRAVTRRTAVHDVRARPDLTSADHVVDLVGKTVTGTGVRLTPTEWHLLEILVRNPGKLVSQRQLLQRGVGPGLPQGDPLPAPVHGPAPPQARTRPRPPGPPAHRAGHGLPLPALIAEPFGPLRRLRRWGPAASPPVPALIAAEPFGPLRRLGRWGSRGVIAGRRARVNQ